MSMLGIHLASTAAIFKIVARSILGCDADVIDLCSRLNTVSGDLHELLSSGRDDEDIDHYDQFAREQARLIERISEIRAFTIAGMVAKAKCALLKPIERGYDGGVKISLSVCRDILLL